MTAATTAISAGKFWGLRRLADADGRFKMTAVDQRPPIVNPIAAKRGGAAPWDDVAGFKAMLVEELQAESSAMLLDPNYAYPRAIRLYSPAKGLILTLEDSLFEETPGGRLSREIDGWSVEKIRRAGGDAVKVLAWYRPDAARHVNEHQKDFVKRIGEACRRFDIPFVFELLVYPLPGEANHTAQYVEMTEKKSDGVLRSVEAFAGAEYGIDVFKLESPVPARECPGHDAPGSERVQALFDEMGRLAGRPWVMLSAGAGMAEFRNILTHAYAAGASGYLAGRAIWADAFKAFPDWEAIRSDLRGAGRDLHARPERAHRCARHAVVRPPRLWRRRRSRGRRRRVPAQLPGDGLMRVGVAALARPTFDVPYATELAAQAFAALDETGWEIVGGRELLFDAAAAERALETLRDAKLDALLLLQVTFTDATMTVEFARAVSAPLLIWAFPEPRIGGRLRLNAFCGLNLALHALGRDGRDPPRWLYAAPDMLDIASRLLTLLPPEPSPLVGEGREGGQEGLSESVALPPSPTLPHPTLPHEGGESVSAPNPPALAGGSGAALVAADQARADAAFARLRNRRIGLVGERPAGFDTCRYDESELASLAGVAVEHIPLAELFARARATPADVVAERRAVIADEIEGLDALDQPQLERSLTIYEALKGLRDDHALGAIAVRCWPETFTEYGCAACAPMGMLTEEGTPCACEADVYGALSTLMLQEIAGDPAWLVDIVDMDAQDDTGVIWHCGSAPLPMRDPECPAVAQIHTNRKMPLLRQFTLKPGRVTLARLTQARNQTALVVATGEVVRRPMAFTGASAVLRFDGGVRAASAGLLDGALEHHLAIVYGDHRGAVEALGARMGLPVRALC